MNVLSLISPQLNNLEIWEPFYNYQAWRGTNALELSELKSQGGVK